MDDGVLGRHEDAALHEVEQEVCHLCGELAIAAHTPRSEGSREGFSCLLFRFGHWHPFDVLRSLRVECPIRSGRIA